MLASIHTAAPVSHATHSRSLRSGQSSTPHAFLRGLTMFGGGKQQTNTREHAKTKLLDLIEPTQRGLLADEAQRQQIEAAAAALEKLNPTKKPLASPLLNGRWRLAYTTSDSILGRSKPSFLRPSGPIYQLLDGPNLRAANKETAPLYNQVYAELEPLSDNKVAVQFKTFKLLGFIPIQAPGRARGELAITYLDEELRVSRGDKGNLFVLVMDDPQDRP